MSVPLNTSLWTPGEARLVAVGGIDIGKGGKGECKDTYAFVLADGARPVIDGEHPTVTGIPAYGSAHPADDSLSVTNIAFTQEGEHSHVWRATVTYSAGEDRDIGDDEEDIARYTRLHFGTVTESQELTVDADDAQVKVVNSAGDPFESVPQVERHFLEIQISRNQNSLPDMSLNGSVNSTALAVAGVSIPVKCGRIAIEADRNFGKGYKYSVNFRITVNPATWALTVLQNGYRYYAGGSGVTDPVKFTETTADGRVVECSTPQLLDEYGYDNRGGDPVYATFAAYPSKNWAGLKLPTTL